MSCSTTCRLPSNISGPAGCALSRRPPRRDWQGLPDVPTLGDFVPGFETSAWAGIGAPKNTRAEIIDTLNREINAALADPTIKARFAELGGEVLALSPSEYGKRIAAETEK